MLTYPVAMKRLDGDIQMKLEALLRRWNDHSDIGRTVVPNLRDLEHFLDVDEMERMLLALVTVANEPNLVEVAVTYRQECYKHTLRGGSIQENATYPFPRILGRAVNRLDFERWLFATYGPSAMDPLHRHFTLPEDAKDFVDRLLAGGPITPAESSFTMSSCGAWVTWAPHAPTQDPFIFAVTGRADEIRANLGLDAAHMGEVLLLRYALDPADVQRPTVADAEIFPYFEPPDSSFELHGWTKPWPIGFLRRAGLDEAVVGPRPEGIHPPIRFGKLTLPLEARA